MALVDGAGIASGAGAAFGTGAVLTSGAGAATGTATLTGGPSLLGGMAGSAQGTTTLTGECNPLGAGLAQGTATVTGAGGVLVFAAGQALGASFVQGQAEVYRIFPAVNAIVSPPKTFRYMQPFQRGDLPIFIATYQGPVSPYRVTYTLFFIRPDSSTVQVGPSGRVPAQGVDGEYYATGRAGEGSQPGRWLIRWEFQQFFHSPVQVKEMCFLVQDAVLSQDPLDTTVRVMKYGWN